VGELAPPASGSFTIVTLSDLKARSGVLLRAYEDAATRGADAFVIGGDLVQQNADFEYRYAVRLLEKAPGGLPVFVTFGNHELWGRHNDASPERYRRWFGPTESWFETKGVLFVSLDTADYAFDEERAEVARKLLAAHRPGARRCVLLSHILPQAGTALEGKHGQEKQLPGPDSERILKIVDDFDVDLILGGHYHGYAATKRRRATMLLTGGGGASLDGPDEFYHYLRVTLAEGGVTQEGVTHEVVKIDSPHGVEWIQYLGLRYAAAILAALSLLVVASSLASRRMKRRGGDA
jgi:3',5'-cyclic AMP phosphodiesterase CpdA